MSLFEFLFCYGAPFSIVVIAIALVIIAVKSITNKKDK